MGTRTPIPSNPTLQLPTCTVHYTRVPNTSGEQFLQAISQKSAKAKAKPTKARPNKDKEECPKAFDRKLSGLQSDDMYTATLPEESLSTLSVFTHGNERGEISTWDE